LNQKLNRLNGDEVSYLIPFFLLLSSAPPAIQ
jgi:hypothetical protein